MALHTETRKPRCLSLAGIAQISNDISRKFLDRSDLSRLLRIASNFLKDHTQVLVELDSFFVCDPNAKIKLVFVEDTVFVKNIFIMSSSMQEIAQKIPENLYVDLLSNIGPGLNLYTVSCEDESGWKICASCISKTNNQDTLRFLLVSVLQSIPKMKAQIKSITLHPGIMDSLDLSSLLPHATVKHCMLLVVEVLEQKMVNLQSETQARIKAVLRNLFQACALKVYNRHLNELKALCPAELLQYYYDTWHPSRKLWCNKDNKRLKVENAIYAYAVNLHCSLSAKVGILPSLFHCLRVVLRETKELNHLAEPLPDMEPGPPPSAPVDETCEHEKNELEHMEFYSWDDFQYFLNIWCGEQKTIFVIRNSVPLTNEDMSQHLMQSLKYSMVNLGCSSYTRKRCPATIQLRLGPQMDKLVITKVDLNHSHDSEIDLPSRFTRNPASYVECPAKLSSDVPDKFMEKTDLTKLIRLLISFSRETQFLEELESLVTTDPGAKVKLSFFDDKLTVKNISFMTTGMQSLLQHFPDHIFITFLPGLNQDFDLYSVLCQDENFSWKICAHCIARKHSTETLQFIIVSILQSLPDLSKQVKLVTLNPDIQNHADAQNLLPNVTIKQCLPFVYDFMNQKMSFLSQMEQSQIKNLLASLAQAASADECTQHLNDLKGACPPEVFQYYCDSLHPCWNLWSRKDSRTNDIEEAMYKYVKIKHQELRAQLGSLSSLYQCLHALLTEDKYNVQEQLESNNTDITDQVSPTCDSQPIKKEDDSPCEEDNCTTDLNKDCDDALNFQLDGKEFQSWQELCLYLQESIKEKYVLRLSSSLPEEGNDETLVVPKVAECLKYSWAQLSCTWRSCSAFIEVTLGPQKDKLVITKTNLQHTHVSEDASDEPPEKKFKPTAAVGLPAQVANNISKKFLELSDVKRLLRFRSGAFEDRTQILAELQTLLVSDPEAKVKLVFVEDKLHVKKIFLMTTIMRNLAENCPEYIFIDVFSEFSQSFDLYTIFCEVKGEGWTPCAYCIAKKGVDGILEFLTSLLFQIVPSISNKVKLLTLHPDFQEQINLETTLPQVNVRYCMHLVLNLMYSRIAHLDAKVEAQIKNFLHILSQTCSLKVYERYLNDLRAICPAEIFQYYYDTWHSCRRMWVKKDNRTEDSERNLSELVSMNRLKLKAELGYMPSLHQCLCAVLGKLKTSDGLHFQNADIASFCEYKNPTILPTSNQQVSNSNDRAMTS